MKKTILQGSVLALLLLGVVSEGQWLGWQSSARSQRTVLEVAVPDKATVTRKQGASLTGQLTAFNQTSLTLSAEGHSEKVPLTQVKAIAFEGDVWIPGKHPPIEFRAFAIKILPDFPLQGLKLGNPPRQGTINLATMSPQGRERLLEDTQNKPHGVKKILLNSSTKMTIHIGEY
ncbi:MAG: hypothetical protein RPG89_08510 [Microcystis panniformis WG22]|nr:hypothetical protein [Microcystis panniformis WG22]